MANKQIYRDSWIVAGCYFIFFALVAAIYFNKNYPTESRHLVSSIWPGWYFLIGAISFTVVTIKDWIVSKKYLINSLNASLFFLLFYLTTLFVKPLLTHF